MRNYYYYPLVFLSLLIGCSDSSLPTNIEWNSSINGKYLRINREQKLLLELDSNFDGGYSWDCDFSDSTIIVLDSVNSRPKNNNRELDGGIAIKTFYFRGIKRGFCKVNLIEHRVWEKDIPPINIIQFNIRVK